MKFNMQRERQRGARRWDQVGSSGIKAKKFRTLLPESVHKLIADNAPTVGSNYDDDLVLKWMEKYNTTHYRASIFFKGPIFYSEIIAVLNPMNPSSIHSYKKCLTEYLLKIQSQDDSSDWTAENFKLYNPKGVRQSKRNLY